MPIQQATTTKQTFTQQVCPWAFRRGTTSSAGNAGGTTAVASALIGLGTDHFVDMWLLCISSNAGEFRRITAFTSASGTITVANAFTAQVGSGVTFEIWVFRPDMLTLAGNRAIPKVYPSVCRIYEGYVLSDADRQMYGVPRDILHVWNIQYESRDSEDMDDHFARANSATDPGTGWTATAGTWGVTSERLYSVTDADADHLTHNPDEPELWDGLIEVIVRGTLANASTYRVPVPTFRIFEDRNGDIDTNNYLSVRLRATGTNSGGAVDLRKMDAGTETSLTEVALTTSNGVDYLVRILFVGNRIRVWVDDVEVITYELQGLNLKYAHQGKRVGIRWDVGGSPATAARVDDYRSHRIVPFMEIRDWEELGDGRTIRIPAQGRFSGMRGRSMARPATDSLNERWLRFIGTSPLTLMATDTTNGTLASYTTAVLEIATTDPAWQLLLAQSLVELYDYVMQFGYEGNEEDLNKLAQAAAKAANDLQGLKRSNSMVLPSPSFRRPY